MNSISLALFFVALSFASAQLDCLNGARATIPWWASIKFPGSKLGHNHLYYDAQDDSAGKTSFNLQNTLVDEEGAGLYNTLNQLNSYPRSQLQLLAFNDEFPNGPTYSKAAHAKGVIAFDPVKNVGFYVMHSTPKYPAITDDFVDAKLPITAFIYAQHYICVTIDRDSLVTILDGLSVAEPNVYYDNAGLSKRASAYRDSQTSCFNIRINRQPISYLTKNQKFPQGLFDDIISPHYGVNLMTESWSHPLEPSKCGAPYESVNIRQLRYNAQFDWIVGADHSKWTISSSTGRNIACFADMNRQRSQMKRGGGALCFEGNSNIFFALKQLVVNFDDCRSFSPEFLAL